MVALGKEERAGGDPKTKTDMANVEEEDVEKRDPSPVKSYSQKFWDIVQGGWKWTSVARHNAVVLLQQPKPEKREKWIIFGSTLYTEGKSGEYTAHELLFDRISPDPSNRLVYVRTVDWKPFIANLIPCSAMYLHFETRVEQVRVLETLIAAYAEPKPTLWNISEENSILYRMSGVSNRFADDTKRTLLDDQLQIEHERELAEKLDDAGAQNPGAVSLCRGAYTAALDWSMYQKRQWLRWLGGLSLLEEHGGNCATAAKWKKDCIAMDCKVKTVKVRTQFGHLKVEAYENKNGHLIEIQHKRLSDQPTSRCHTIMPLVAIPEIADVYERYVDSEHYRREVEDWPDVEVMTECASQLFEKGAGECCPPSQITI